MSSAYEQLKPFMDAQVDSRLGDSIGYKINNVAVEGATTAFLIDLNDDGTVLDGIRSSAHRWQLKIRKSLLPERPSMTHQVTAAKLDGPYRPAANIPIDGGDYWLVDLQKAPA